MHVLRRTSAKTVYASAAPGREILGAKLVLSEKTFDGSAARLWHMHVKDCLPVLDIKRQILLSYVISSQLRSFIFKKKLKMPAALQVDLVSPTRQPGIGDDGCPNHRFRRSRWVTNDIGDML
jgi:hypothetical protein